MASSVPCCVCELAFSGTQSSDADTQPCSTPRINSSMRSLFCAGCDMRRMMSASSAAWHSTSVCPWNMVLTTGRLFPEAKALHVNLKPIMSPISLMWWVGIMSTLLDCSCANMLCAVTRSSLVRACSAYWSMMRCWMGCAMALFQREGGYICPPLFSGQSMSRDKYLSIHGREMVTVNTVCTDAVHDISRTLREMNTVQQNNTGVTDEIKKIRVDRVVIENLLDMVDEIAAHFHHDQVDLSMIRSDLRGQLGHAKAALRKLVTEYQEKMGTFLKITNHRRRRAKRTGTTRRDFDEDNTSDTGESASGEDDYVSATDIQDEDEEQPTRTTQGVHPAVADILREALHGTEEIQRNARAFIADVEEMSNVVRDIRQEIDDTTAERKGLARKAAENGRESPQLAERIRENQKHIEDLNRELLQEREMRANYEKQARSLEAEAQEIIKEMEHIQQDHSTQHKENETKIAERVTREVRQTIQKMHDELELEGSDSSDAGDDRGSRRHSNARTYRASAEENEDLHNQDSSDAGNDRGSSRNSHTRSSRSSSEEREDLHDTAQTKIEKLLEKTEDVGAEAVVAVEEAGAIGHQIAELKAGIDETADQLTHLRETAKEHPEDTGLTQIMHVTEARLENLAADLEDAQEALDQKQDQIIEIHQIAESLEEKASQIQTTGNTGRTARQEQMQEIQRNLAQTLAQTRPKPTTPMPARRHTRTGS